MNENRFNLLAAVHIFLLKNEEILFLRRFNTGYEDGNYSVIAGHLDGDEEVKTAAAREALEEAGIVIDPADLQVVGVMHRKANSERVDFFVATQRWAGEIVNNEPNKSDQIAWFPIDALPQNTIPYVRRAISNYRQGIWFDSFGW